MKYEYEVVKNNDPKNPRSKWVLLINGTKTSRHHTKREAVEVMEHDKAILEKTGESPKARFYSVAYGRTI